MTVNFSGSIPHLTTHEASIKLFFKRSLRTTLDLLKPDVNSSICFKQKGYHDSSCQVREYSMGQRVQTYNFRSGPCWVAGVVVKKLGFLTYLVQVNSGNQLNVIIQYGKTIGHHPDIQIELIYLFLLFLNYVCNSNLGWRCNE